MTIYDWTRKEVLIFALVAFRMASFIFSAGVFGYPVVNNTLKLLLSLCLSFIMYPLVKVTYGNGFNEDLIVSYAIHEVVVGLMLGYMTRFFFFSISQFAELIGVSMGLSSAQLLNPLTGGQSNVLDQFFMMIALVIYLAMNGHHAMIESLFRSYEIHPLNVGLNVAGFKDVTLALQFMLVQSVKLAAPIMIAMLLTNILMGILGRAIPQINVLMTSFSVTILLGFGIVIICMPLVIQQSTDLMSWNLGEIFRLVRSF